VSLTIKGVQGWVYYGGRKVLRMNTWTMNQNAGIGDVTDFHSSGVEREYTGIVDITGSLNGVYELADTSTGGAVDSPVLNITQMFETGGSLAKGYAKFIESTRSVWRGNIVFTDFAKNQPAAAHQTITLNWAAADGRLVHSSATST